MAKRKHNFQTIRSEGAILPPDLLQRVAALEVDGVRPSDYHLPEGLKLNEEISRAWNRLQACWKAFSDERERIPDSDNTGGITTRDKWLLPLFQELGYGRLTTSKSPEIEGRSYPIERFYSHVPLHLIGCKLPLDKRTPGARGAATASPHSLLQEFLNRSDGHLWAFLSNGHQLRILRDNYSLSRQSYVEFDLQAMMDGEVYPDFARLWMLCHQSRVEADEPDQCWLEKWSKLAHDQGTRILNELRGGVEKAIEALGVGFLAHRGNAHLREKVQSGDLSTQDYYRQLLRIVYRLLFLFVAEDRELLHPRLPEDASEDERRQHEQACLTYDQHYSLRRLRDLAERIRGSKHADLWHTLSLVFDTLASPTGRPQLALPGLGSFLWDPDSTADLLGPIPDPMLGRPDSVLIANHHLLNAVRALAFTVQNRTLRAVDYKNLGSEELGSVYESLLELHPEVNTDARTFSLRTAAGSERKTTGSYYTPDSLVQCLLDSALEPVIGDRLKPCKTDAEREDAILNLRVCDPAVGSGHFLISAAHRLARHLSRIRCGESEPTPDVYQHALRDVIRRCVYGVDINPMSAELCKVALWMESIDPGKPLTFLDAHIQVGNSLLGTTPALLKAGIPDDAFKPIEGDVKSVAAELKKRNKNERKDIKQDHLFEPILQLGNLPTEFTRLSGGSDDSVAVVNEKARQYAALVSGADYQNARMLADTWCAAFVWKKDAGELGELCPTERDFRKIENNPHSILPHVMSEVRRLADQYQFFHWHLAFPDVFRLPGEEAADNEQTGWSRGFDVVLGNPPWERTFIQEKEFFAQSHPEIANATSKKRRRLIADLTAEAPEIFDRWTSHCREQQGEKELMRGTGAFPLSTINKFNIYAVFVERAIQINSSVGRIGLIVPSGITSDHMTRFLFGFLLENGRLISAYDIENANGLFPIHRGFRFTLLAGSGSATSTTPVFGFRLTDVSQITDKSRVFPISREEILQLNPESKNCPSFARRNDAVIVLAIHKRYPPFGDSNNEEGRWRVDAKVMFNLTNDTQHFVELVDVDADSLVDAEDQPLCRLIEAKMFHQFDHRFAGISVNEENLHRKSTSANTELHEYTDPTHLPLPRYFIRGSILRSRAGSSQWRIVYRNITDATTNARTGLFAIVSAEGIGHTGTVLDVCKSHDARESAVLLAAFNSFVVDYTLRQKVTSTHLLAFVLRQLPLLPPCNFPKEMPFGHGFLTFVGRRVLELTYTAWDLEAFALDCVYAGPPFRWDEERRFLLRCELDAAYFHLYMGPPAEWGTDNAELREMFPTPRDAVDYIMDTFPIVKRKDIKRTEIKNEAGDITTEGTYITKKTILEIYDDMQSAIDFGTPYQTRLDPPPGPPTDGEGNYVPPADWDEANLPSHIHATKEGAETK